MLHLLLPLTILALDPCIIVEGPQIQAQDLAPHLTAFATLAPATVLASSPNFGVRRDVSIQTLRLWASIPSLQDSDFDPICIFRRSAMIEDFSWESELRQALDSLFGLQIQEDALQILDKKISPGPKGHIALKRNGLSYNAAKQQYLWHGKIDGPSGYAALRICFTMNHRQPRKIASRNLPAGKPVEASDFEDILLPWHPASSNTRQPSVEFEGRILRRSLTKGTILESIHLMEAPVIRSGDTVELISQAGRASVRTPAVARGIARLGDPLLIATLDGKKLLRAIAIGPGIVEIRSGMAKKEQ